MQIRIIVAALACAASSACVSSGGGDTVKQISSDLAANARVSEVVLAGAPANVSAEFATVFQQKVTEKLAACAKGQTPLRLEATISDFKRANPAAAYLVGSSNMIKGTAKLVDPATGAVVADYDVTRSVGGGGLIAAAAMAQADEQMSNAFGDEVCKRAFIRR